LLLAVVMVIVTKGFGWGMQVGKVLEGFVFCDPINLDKGWIC
jgi:hypothetical protein